MNVYSYSITNKQYIFKNVSKVNYINLNELKPLINTFWYKQKLTGYWIKVFKAFVFWKCKTALKQNCQANCGVCLTYI